MYLKATVQNGRSRSNTPNIYEYNMILITLSNEIRNREINCLGILSFIKFIKLFDKQENDKYDFSRYLFSSKFSFITLTLTIEVFSDFLILSLYLSLYISLSLHTHTHTHKHACVYICMHLYVCSCVFTYVCVCVLERDILSLNGFRF